MEHHEKESMNKSLRMSNGIMCEHTIQLFSVAVHPFDSDLFYAPVSMEIISK